MKTSLIVSAVLLCLFLPACGKKASPPATVQAVPMPQTQTKNTSETGKTPVPTTNVKNQTIATPVVNTSPSTTVKTATSTAPAKANATSGTPQLKTPPEPQSGKGSILKDLDSATDAATGMSSLKVKANVTKKLQDIQNQHNDKINSALKE